MDTAQHSQREPAVQRAGGRPRAPGWPWPGALVAATVVWNLWQLRATTGAAQYPNDSAVHEQMVRFATARLAAGHDPLTSWFPYLGLGSPQFLHYQSTPAILTGAVGLITGPDVAFRWSLYLLWCLWPVAIYSSARLLRLRPWAAAAAAAAAPLLHSVPGVGYEQHAYLWVGYGVWTQLWGSWALPYAWALTWRAVADRRFLAPAAAAVALTAAFHYETGYLAFLAVGILPFLIRTGLRARLLRAAVLLAVSALASAWVVVPLLAQARWAAVNQALAGTPLARGYGAGTTLDWLVTGRLLDDGQLPVISLAALAGLVTVLLRWRRAAGPGRALVALLAASLLLSFGPATLGPLASVIPGHADLFFRRFLMGAQLACIYLAGLGAAAVAGQAWRLVTGFLDRRELARLAWLPAAAIVIAGVAGLFPALSWTSAEAALNATDVRLQVRAQHNDTSVAAAVAYVKRHGGGRIYAGAPDNWGQTFPVGFVSMYAYLGSQDVAEVGWTLRTASLMSQPEYRFDPASPGEYALFGIRYLLLPATAATPSATHPPAGARLVLTTSVLRLYQLAGDSYVRVADTVGSVAANRADVGSATATYQYSGLAAADRYLTVAWDGAPAAPPTLAAGAAPATPPGTVRASRDDLADGTATATVTLRRRAVVVLSASFDPGWTVTVDGRRAATEMIAPALVGVTVPPGTHRVVFRYTGFGWYPELFALALLALAATALVTLRRPATGNAG